MSDEQSDPLITYLAIGMQMARIQFKKVAFDSSDCPIYACQSCHEIGRQSSRSECQSAKVQPPYSLCIYTFAYRHLIYQKPSSHKKHYPSLIFVSKPLYQFVRSAYHYALALHQPTSIIRKPFLSCNSIPVVFGISQ